VRGAGTGAGLRRAKNATTDQTQSKNDNHTRPNRTDDPDAASRNAPGEHMELQIVLIVIAVVGVLVGGTVFSAWRAERAEDEERDSEQGPGRSA
jgi:hypothetical protein